MTREWPPVLLSGHRQLPTAPVAGRQGPAVYSCHRCCCTSRGVPLWVPSGPLPFSGAVRLSASAPVWAASLHSVWGCLTFGEHLHRFPFGLGTLLLDVPRPFGFGLPCWRPSALPSVPSWAGCPPALYPIVAVCWSRPHTFPGHHWTSGLCFCRLLAFAECVACSPGPGQFPRALLACF